MQRHRFQELSGRYGGLKIALAGDVCLDRYLEIDPARTEVSIETGLPVHNVVRVRAQPGAAGTILNNLVALGIGQIHVIGFCGVDGEGFELRRALAALPGVVLEDFFETPERRTFTYGKPLVRVPGHPPEELSRLDMKNWAPTPPALQERLALALERVAPAMDAVILMDQVDQPETGVVTPRLLKSVDRLGRLLPGLLVLADSRRSLKDYPPALLKMNRSEFLQLRGLPGGTPFAQIESAAREEAAARGRPLFVTLAEEGILGAAPDGTTAHEPALPLRGVIDIVGAGDAVTANLAAALAAGATLLEAVQIANRAASLVIHQLGTTGVATPAEIAGLF